MAAIRETIEQSAANPGAATAAMEHVMRTNLRSRSMLNLGPQQLGASGDPARLTAGAKNVKSAMLAVDGLIIEGGTGDADIQNRVSAACALVTNQLREHVEVNCYLRHRVGAFVLQETCTYFALSVVVSALQACSHHPILPKADDVKAAVMVGQRTSHLGPHEVTATDPGALAEWFVIDGDRVAPGQPLVRRHPPVSAL